MQKLFYLLYLIILQITHYIHSLKIFFKLLYIYVQPKI